MPSTTQQPRERRRRVPATANQQKQERAADRIGRLEAMLGLPPLDTEGVPSTKSSESASRQKRKRTEPPPHKAAASSAPSYLPTEVSFLPQEQLSFVQDEVRSFDASMEDALLAELAEDSTLLEFIAQQEADALDSVAGTISLSSAVSTRSNTSSLSSLGYQRQEYSPPEEWGNPRSISISPEFIPATTPPSNHGSLNLEMSIFEGLPPIPDPAVLRELLDVYFETVAKSFPFIHRKRFFANNRMNDKPLVWSMISAATAFISKVDQPHPLRPLLIAYGDRLLPYLLSRTPTIPIVQALFHLAIDGLTSSRMEKFHETAAACVAGFRVAAAFDLSGMSSSNGGNVQPPVDMDVWFDKEEARRTAWFVAGWLDKMVGLWQSKPGVLGYDELALMTLPCHESLWSDDISSTYTTPLNLVGILQRPGLIFAAPTLERFYDYEAWPLERTTEEPLGAMALGIALSTTATDKILEFRHYCSRRGIITTNEDTLSSFDASSGVPPPSMAFRKAQQLNDQVAVAMTTWYARFHAALGLPIPPIVKNVCEAALQPKEPPHPTITSQPWALAHFIQYHALCSLWSSPIPPAGAGAEAGPSPLLRQIAASRFAEACSPTPPSVTAWMSSSAFVMSLDHARVTFAALEMFLETYGEHRLFEFSTVGSSFTVGMSAVSVLVAIKEMQHIIKVNLASEPSGDCALILPQNQVIAGFMLQASQQIKTAVRTTQALGKIWKKGQATAKLIESMAASVCSGFSSDAKLSELAHKWPEHYGMNETNSWNSVAHQGASVRSMYDIASRRISDGIQGSKGLNDLLHG
ncbi:hypothetical protein M427DRAFT_60967 [Gonapodya prolifera JEL478]|uniref:Xylanolytic transcriptional activator regulatory domain-containing protein n=1 Tax=Gonapodya prolifera (strain JEL478) TaxID=1344416 RepID=A0A139A376_GONPJ|nr:hypothetical protein M427DRAFT_60967 [Gonapodya prolifera JEL478]|eukprot:KXS11164.1 hypothetical protein M427DRAFT_60967 [Gonapodya prolifera JEL478]